MFSIPAYQGDALGIMILNNPEQLKKFGLDDKFWKNFSDAIQDRARAAAKVENDAALIHLNVRTKEYIEEINIVLAKYHEYKINDKAAREDNSGFFAKQRVNLFSSEDGRGLFRIKMLITLFNDAANDPMRQLILILAVLANDDSKKLRKDMATKVKEQDITKLLTEFMKLIHGNKFTLDMPDLKEKLLAPINMKTNHPPKDEKEALDHHKLFEPELDLIKQFELSGTLHKAPGMRM
jgi:hypothetical protein